MILLIIPIIMPPIIFDVSIVTYGKKVKIIIQSQPVFMDGAIPVLKEATRKGYAIIIITNQYIIDEGCITVDQYHDINRQMVEQQTVCDNVHEPIIPKEPFYQVKENDGETSEA
ncbi:hypothetical protein [Alteribacter natronophilus]|uniref:hypothetical protein n=1 Tax=Alteribacter natronophilus TaxID=2583810 RepID=UPI00110DD694|nr:hypothetical protein [Alteribacter natronophilus]TMW71178.1 hypothetical protein FGB90_14550 [Alteribacter natronophilus]